MFISTLKNEYIILRPFEHGDIPYWQIWDVDPQVQKYMPEPVNEPVSIREQEQYLEECGLDEQGLYATIVLQSTQLPVGTISLTDINMHHGIGELGIVIGDKTVWCKGVASQAISLFLDDIKNQGLRRIHAEFESGNDGMQKALEKNGFEVEAISVKSRMKKGRQIDTVRMVKFL